MKTQTQHHQMQTLTKTLLEWMYAHSILAKKFYPKVGYETTDGQFFDEDTNPQVLVDLAIRVGSPYLNTK